MRTKLAILVVLLGVILGSCTGAEGPEVPEATQEPETEARSELVQPAKWWEKLPRPVYANLSHVGTYQNWFEVYELLPGTFAIYEPYQFEESISYLVVGDESDVST